MEPHVTSDLKEALEPAVGTEGAIPFDKPTKLQDNKGHVYTVLFNKPIGKGGQGIVAPVAEDHYLAVKIAFCKDQKDFDYTQRRLKRVSLLPIPRFAHISMPIALLKDQAGFVMYFLKKMKPISKFMPCLSESSNLASTFPFADQSSEQNIFDSSKLNSVQESEQNSEQSLAQDLAKKALPAWLQTDGEMSSEQIYAYQQIAFFAKTGGLRARLNWLLQTAQQIMLLHDQGLIFADISPNNVYISSGKEQEVWLIDVDNIEYNDKVNFTLSTPKYGAYEIISEELKEPDPNLTDGLGYNSVQADLFSFAVLSFEVLTNIWPFEDQNSDDFCDSLPKLGAKPWVLDSKDPSNHIPANAFSPFVEYNLSLPLYKLFAQSFEEGLKNPFLRPPIGTWVSVLQRTLDLTVSCPSCGMSFIFSEKHLVNCDFCHSALQVLTVSWEAGVDLKHLSQQDFQKVAQSAMPHAAPHADNSNSMLFAHEFSTDLCLLPRRLFVAELGMDQANILSIAEKNNTMSLRLFDENTEPVRWCLVSCSGQCLNQGILDASNSELNLSILKDQVGHSVLCTQNYPSGKYILLLQLDNPDAWCVKLELQEC